MPGGRSPREEFAYEFTEEKLRECAHMTPKQVLDWLEEANRFVNKALGLKRRAEWDDRFAVFVRKRRRSAPSTKGKL